LKRLLASNEAGRSKGKRGYSPKGELKELAIHIMERSELDVTGKKKSKGLEVPTEKEKVETTTTGKGGKKYISGATNELALSLIER